jgi:16S rRNA (uracil1498-N3)-methyltransferase
MPQFYLPPPWESEKPISLTTELAHHLRVRRIQIGETFPVFDGNGQIGQATLLSLTGKTGQAQLSNIQTDTHRETSYAITLAQGLAGGDKMDWIVEKAVEIDVLPGDIWKSGKLNRRGNYTIMPSNFEN